jgi:hypothetical protein
VKYIDEDKNEYNIDETNISTYFPQVEWVD